jgi:hypothetical protein
MQNIYPAGLGNRAGFSMPMSCRKIPAGILQDPVGNLQVILQENNPAGILQNIQF